MINNKLHDSASDFQGHSPKRLSEAERRRSNLAGGLFTFGTLVVLAVPLVASLRHLGS